MMTFSSISYPETKLENQEEKRGERLLREFPRRNRMIVRLRELPVHRWMKSRPLVTIERMLFSSVNEDVIGDFTLLPCVAYPSPPTEFF